MRIKCHHSHDRWGVALSLLCLVHCLLFPVLIGAGFMWSTHSLDHLFIHILFFSIAFFIVIRRLRSLLPEQRVVKTVFILSLSLLFVGVLAEGLFHLHSLELVSTVMGASGLMLGHLYCEFFS